jgi:2-polyprenyl-3-methyl-5-hydroxy-6-metoxy-1,4-benzoquinol methylase
MTRVLDLGCGRAKTPGALGIDSNPNSDADVIHDLDMFPYPLIDNSFDQVICNGIVEHLDDIKGVMEELHRICRPGATIMITTPYFTSVDAFTDPTHKHYFSSRSFDYFTGDFPEWSLPRLGNIRPQHWLGAKLLARCLPMIYERFFAYIFPAQTIYFELVVEK